MTKVSAHPFAPGALTPDIDALLSACPSAAIALEEAPETAAGWRCRGANTAALVLLRLERSGLGPEALGAALAASLHDEREPAFRERVRACACGEPAAPLKVLAQLHDGTGEVLLEVRFVPRRETVVVFLQEARARGRESLPDGVDPAATLRAIYDIARATHEVATLDALFERIHRTVERLIGAKNFFIALIDEPEQMVRFAYSRDEFDDPRPDRPLGLGLTELVYLTGQPLLLDRANANRMLQEGTVVNHGVPAQVWLGVPLQVAGRTLGVMAVQDYHNPNFLGETERQLLTYISDQIANAIAVKRAGDEARAARGEAERAGRVKADFMAVMSHELRTPLTVIIGFSELLQATLADAKQAQQAASIGQAGHRLLAAVNQILDFSRVDALAQPVHEEIVDLAELLIVCEGFFSARLREKKLDYAVRREGFVPPCVRTDGQLLKQILIHLLSNAVKFTPAGGRIALGLRAEPAAPFQANRHRLEISVEDNGAGIEPEMLPRLFQPFEQGHRPGAMEGAGLGLALSQRLAALLGGRITVRSAPGKGSVFTLSLTVAAATHTGQEPPVPDPTERLELLLRSRLANHAWRVLVVDESAEMRLITSGLVESLTGQPPLVAESGPAALAACRGHAPHVVLIDTHGGTPDGIETCRALREPHEAGAARPFVIAVSVDHSPALVQRCLAAGADTYLPKPLSRRALVEALLAALGKMTVRA